MNQAKLSVKRKPKAFYLDLFLNEFWYIPSDVLQRGMEANVWHLFELKRPILDIGIGNGQITSFIFNKIKNIDVGIDINEEGLRTARKSGIYRRALLENAEKMSFKDASFTTIVSNSTFEHIKHDIKAIGEVSRVLKKNGTFIFTVPSNFLKEWILETELEKTTDKGEAKKRLDDFNKRANHLHYRSILDWDRILKGAGLEIEYSSYFFKKDVAMYWYKLFRIYTSKIKRREVWSYLRDSKLSFFIPKRLLKKVTKKMLKDKYESGFLLDNENGAQLVIIARKV